MKTILAFIIGLFPLYSNCQSYQSVIENNDSIQILYDLSWGEGNTQSVSIVGDTTINSKIYSRLNFYFFSYHFFNEIICINNNCINTSGNSLLLREDSLKSKLFLYSIQSQKEYVIMDLDLAKNDSFKIKKDNGTLSFIVDSIYSSNGRKVVEFSDFRKYNLQGSVKLKFIEGIGPNWGFFYAFNDYNDLLLCSYKNEKEVYKVSENSECYYHWYGDCYCCVAPWLPGCVGINTKENEIVDDILISTEHSNLIIRSNSNTLFRFDILDMMGRWVFKQSKYISTANISLDRDKIYFVRLSQRDKVIVKKVLIK